MRGDYQAVGSDSQFNLIIETALFNQWLWDSNSPGVADARELSPHSCFPPRNYIAITRAMMGKSIGPGSGVTGSTRWASEVGDPSLRLKSGFAQDDTFEKKSGCATLSSSRRPG